MCAVFVVKCWCTCCKHHNHWFCYHHTVDTEEEIELKKEKCRKMEIIYLYLKDLTKNESWIYFVMSDDPNVINGNLHQLIFILSHLQKIGLLNYTLAQPNLATRQERLREVFTCQSTYLNMSNEIDRYENSRSVQKIGYSNTSMHVISYNRVTKKIFYKVLKKVYLL